MLSKRVAFKGQNISCFCLCFFIVFHFVFDFGAIVLALASLEKF